MCNINKLENLQQKGRYNVKAILHNTTERYHKELLMFIYEQKI